METSPDALSDPSPSWRAVKDISFGSIAGMVSKIFEHPFDLTKVRLQSQVLDATPRFTGPIDCLIKTWKNEGVRGLYRGLPAPIVGAMTENASLFLSYSELQDVIRWASAQNSTHDLSLPQLALAAGGAGAVTSFLLSVSAFSPIASALTALPRTPIELVKCKMQVQMLTADPALASATFATSPSVTVTTPPRIFPGPISVLLNVIRTTGVRGLWLGHTGTLIRESGGSAAWFSTKEYVASLLVARHSAPAFHQKTRKHELQPWESAVSGACAGFMYNLALFPADTVKSAIQTEEELRPRAPGVPRPTFAGMFREMYRKGGVQGLYAGCGITVARSIPSSAIIFLIYDGLDKRFG